MLPIALKSFHIKNYRGIIDTQIDNIPPDTQWIFLTGENGFGKTSVLQGIVAENDKVLSGRDCNFRNTDLYIYLQQQPFKMRFTTKNSVDTIYEIFPKMVGYGSTRLRVSAGVTKEVSESFSSTSSLFSNETLLINIEENFKDWKNNYSEGFDALKNIFKTLLPNLSKIEVEFDEKDKRVKLNTMKRI